MIGKKHIVTLKGTNLSRSLLSDIPEKQDASEFNLQDYLDKLAATYYDLLIVDLYYGSEPLTPEEVKALQHKPNGAQRQVFAYMSVGEAETYRPYWQGSWGVKMPDWLAAKNDDWADNYKVKYWRPEWRQILYGSQEAYLDRILSAGFDGAFLDVVDAYWYFLNPQDETE